MASPGSGAKDRNTGGNRGSSGNTGGGDAPSFGRQNVVATNPVTGAPFGPTDTWTNGPMAGQTTQSATFGNAKEAYDNRGILSKLRDFVTPFGFGSVQPNPKQPSSYVGGDYHYGLNPGGLLGGIGGMFMGPAGAIMGKLGSVAYNATGLPDAVLGGPGVASLGGTPPGPSGTPSTQTAGFGNTGGGPPTRDGGQQLTQLAQLHQNIPGNPGAPSLVTPPAQQPPSQPPMPQGPNYQQIMAQMRQITPGYGVQLPSYQYRGRATV